MKISTAIITMFLILGLLGVPSGVFAQESSPTGPDSTIQCSDSMVLNSMVPLLKGSKSSSSKKKLDIDIDDDDDTDDSTDDGSSGGFSWITAIIMVVLFLGIVGFLAWFFFLRK